MKSSKNETVRKIRKRNVYYGLSLGTLQLFFFTICNLQSATCNRASAQDLHFSQVLETPLLLNPASTGVFNGFCRA